MNMSLPCSTSQPHSIPPSSCVTSNKTIIRQAESPPKFLERIPKKSDMESSITRPKVKLTYKLFERSISAISAQSKGTNDNSRCTSGADRKTSVPGLPNLTYSQKDQRVFAQRESQATANYQTSLPAALRDYTTFINNIIKRVDEMMNRFQDDDALKGRIEQPESQIPHSLCLFYGNRTNIPNSRETIRRDRNALNTELMKNIFLDHLQLPMSEGLSTLLNTKTPLTIVFEDDNLLVVNKPSRQLTTPNPVDEKNGTSYYDIKDKRSLAYALIQHRPELKELPQCGLINRLDYGTSGLCIAVKNIATMSYMKACDDCKAEKYYLCIVDGIVAKKTGTLASPIQSRHSRQLQPAKTNYWVLKEYRNHTLIKCQIITGRKNQIRIHMQRMGHPIVGDRQFNEDYMSKGPYDNQIEHTIKKAHFKLLSGFGHVALHSHTLSFIHPRTNSQKTLTAPIPDDFANLQRELEAEPVKPESASKCS